MEMVVVASVVAALVELVLHYFPWRLAMRRDVPRVVAYICGVLGFAAPYSLLLLFFEREGVENSPLFFLVCFWWIVGSAGGAVVLAYFVDWILVSLAKGREMGELYEAGKIDIDSAR